MSYSLQECIQIAQKEYPDMYPYAYVEKDGKYIFNLIRKGASVDHAIADFHLVNSETGAITGSISTMELLGNKEFREKWKNATVIKNEESEVKHSGFFIQTGIGWAIHRNADQELTHHGIKGQSWGVRNGPPYPLDQKTHNSVVNNQNKSTEKGLIPELVIGASMIWSIDSMINGPITRLVKRIKQNKKTNQSKELNDTLIGDIAEHKEFGQDIMPKEIVGEHSINDDMAAVNPYYAGASVPGTTNNCVLCSFTYDLRRRGYDVTAKPSIEGNYDDVLMHDLYEGAHVDKINGRDWYEIYDKAAQKFPEGSRGVFGAYGVFGGGHAMAWEIHNGKLEIIDAQRNVRSSPEELTNALYSLSGEFIRTDNLKVRPSGISKVSSELKDNWSETVRNKNKEKAIKEIESKQEFSGKKPSKRMTKQEKMRALENIWRKDHLGTYMDAQAEEYMKNWVNANMWSMHGHEGKVLIHNNRGAYAMGDNTATWGVHFSGAPNTDISHSGIKGQKWGVRRFQNEDGTLTEAGKERYYKDTSKDGKKTGMNKNGEPVVTYESKTWKAKEAEELSDAEIDRRNRRLQKERQYKDLTTPQWKKDIANVGKEALKALLITSAVTPLAVVMGRKYKQIFAKARDFIHRVVGKPLPKPTNPETYFNGGKKKGD